jgi:hypothetical protein
MGVTRISVVVLVAATFSSSVRGQEYMTDQRPRFLLAADVGSEGLLGYKFPSTAAGPSFEIPLENHLEIQASAFYSPDRKLITDNGDSLKVSGSVVGFATERVGFIGSIEHAWLWTSQFDKANWFPAAGVVLRNDSFGPGRLYVTYLIPTGCVWATTTNPCAIQSNRLQGVQLQEDVRAWSHGRMGLETGVYHFCDEGNPYDPQAGRKCHLGATMLLTFSLEFHLGRNSHFSINDDSSEHF